mmetsp:Transcript_30734/g.65242  ORF Transcript_30734/g.65242 Transcript_30734/m.65242 type:complete len:105 (+) Transcript_30734:307-621(+)|eukprot:CAMPEP_0204292518 /NCGR_PEP_ID=MMETSP0468-20130131/64477_1 /ASSEMBLY_ACC=CAM_ASM_000383 /TAXON_ID=2969 /ORGANISM="Oxyrrhis marina" /LENGTH=104 /DNA_ID=CAMNT_0051270911 /DNA_START=121 /DNA_END=435 /DNA_ORIENTATION=-
MTRKTAVRRRMATRMRVSHATGMPARPNRRTGIPTEARRAMGIPVPPSRRTVTHMGATHAMVMGIDERRSGCGWLEDCVGRAERGVVPRLYTSTDVGKQRDCQL